MSNVITSFLVGIGFDYDKKSADQIGTGIDGIKSKALQLGAVVAGAFGIKALTADFAQSRDMLGKFAEVFGVSANDVQAFGNALATEGGTLESFMSQLESIERARARIRVGDVGFFAPAGKAGIDPNQIADARTATEAYLGLADAFAGMNAQQRINAAEALGLDEASIRLLSQGRESVEALVAKFATIRPVTTDMTESAAEFNRQWLEMQQNIGGVADRISDKLVPAMSEAIRSVNGWVGANRDLINQYAVDPIAEQADKIAVTATLLGATGGLSGLAAMAKHIPAIGSGLSGVAGALSRITAVGAAFAGAGVVSGTIDNILRSTIGEAYDKSDAALTKFIYDSTGIDVSRGDVYTGTKRSDTAIGQLVKATLGTGDPAEITEATGLPEWLFKPISGLQKEIFYPDASPDVADAIRMLNAAPPVTQGMYVRPESERVGPTTERAPASQPGPTTQNINVSLELDGNVIDRRVVRVVDGMAQTAIDDLTSSTGG